MKKNKHRHYSRLFRMTKTKFVFRIAVVVVALACIAFAVKLARHYQSLSTGAASSQVTLSIQPKTGIMNPGGIFEVWAFADGPVAFVHTEIIFDQSMMHLAKEVVFSGSLSRVISKTTLSEANSTGKIVFTLGLDPSQIASPPTGSFKLATLSFSSAITATNVGAALEIPTASIQVVGLNASIFSSTSTGATITINPPIPSPSPTPKPSILPTLTPKPTITPTPKPSILPTLTPTPILTTQTSPFFATWRLPSGRHERYYSTKIAVADKNILDALQLTVTGLPSGLALGDCRTRIDSNNHQVELACMITGTPDKRGWYLPKFTVSDGTGLSKSKTYTLIIR